MSQASSNIIVELQKMIDSGVEVDDGMFKRLMLLGMLQLYERLGAMESRVRRDWTPTVVTVTVAVLAIVTSWLR